MRILSLHFPRLSIQLALRQRPELEGRPVAAVAGSGASALVAAVSTEATARGVVPGLTPAQARARFTQAVFLPDNAGACLDELERIASIIRLRATGIVAVVSREDLLLDMATLPRHLGENEAQVADRVVALVRMWTGLSVRAAVASSRAEARQAAPGARLAPAIRPPVLAWGEPPLQAAGTGPLAAEVSIPLGTSPLAARAKLVRAAAKLQALLEGGAWSYRDARLILEARDGARTEIRRLLQPTSDAHTALHLLAPALDDQALAAATSIRLELGKLGPDVSIAPVTAREPLLRAG